MLLNALEKALGDYIEGINGKNLRLGIWAGKVALSNLTLNSKKIQELNLPVRIEWGSVKSLEASKKTDIYESTHNPPLTGIYPLDIVGLGPRQSVHHGRVPLTRSVECRPARSEGKMPLCASIAIIV